MHSCHVGGVDMRRATVYRTVALVQILRPPPSHRGGRAFKPRAAAAASGAGLWRSAESEADPVMSHGAPDGAFACTEFFKSG
eukprot:CAMPEP_0170405594 /NCGR_PEP_ID=MMETSP0117_2-20130122/27265_1 /TAXON_ID=400756 /ORGANISM="Durinskia baltica, Strain CSIRO CS-38" /LENGTH=81 /DNA_ID=CAMNT_0010662721 /DNA_START=1 /DNA_END=242 /DNA_ORIENTATION=+